MFRRIKCLLNRHNVVQITNMMPYSRMAVADGVCTRCRCLVSGIAEKNSLGFWHRWQWKAKDGSDDKLHRIMMTAGIFIALALLAGFFIAYKDILFHTY